MFMSVEINSRQVISFKRLEICTSKCIGRSALPLTWACADLPVGTHLDSPLGTSEHRF